MGTQKSRKTEELDQTGQTGNGTRDNMGSVGGPLASLRQRVAVALAAPSCLWAKFTGKFMTVWRFVSSNKKRLLLTILLVMTVIGTVAALYLWRREITDFIAWAIDGAITRVRGSRFARPDDLVVIGQSMSVDGTERTVYRTTSREF